MLLFLRKDEICFVTNSYPFIGLIHVYAVVPCFIGCELSGVAGFLASGEFLYIYFGLLFKLSRGDFHPEFQFQSRTFSQALNGCLDREGLSNCRIRM